jgi:methylmalonyl-CoA mutase C-terminal domain/subunit
MAKAKKKTKTKVAKKKKTSPKKKKVAKRAGKAARKPVAKKKVGGGAKAKSTPISTPKKKIDVRSIFASSPIIEREGGQIRVLIGKAGLDGHDRGAKVIARACRDAGFEVVYTGLHQTPEMIVNTAIQEDVDVVGLSILSGAHNYLVPEVIKSLAAQGVKVGQDILILVGGIIPESDFAGLKKAGVSMVFTPGTSVESIITYIREHVKPKA